MTTACDDTVATHPLVLDEALVDPALSGQHVLAELLAVVLASEEEGAVQVEVVRLETSKRGRLVVGINRFVLTSLTFPISIDPYVH